jgi:hypothetical protein
MAYNMRRLRTDSAFFHVLTAGTVLEKTPKEEALKSEFYSASLFEHDPH